MFDSVARQELEEMLGYERFVLIDCRRRLEEAHGHVEPLEIIIHDQGPHDLNLKLVDTFGGGSTIEVYDQLKGLLFSAAYKILDMMIEWTLRENGMPPDKWRFSDKVSWLARPNLSFPDFLGTDSQLQEVLTSCYRRFLPFRNAMTHGQWGELKNGALHFDFVDRGGHHAMIFTSDQVMAWVEAVSQIASMLIVPALATPKAISAAKRNLDLIQIHHGEALFSIPEPRTFHVVRRREATSPFLVDLKRIHSIAETQAQGQPYEVQLRIEQGLEGNRKCWEIPPENIPANDFLLDAAWDRFKVIP
jgi:hypothetical protein